MDCLCWKTGTTKGGHANRHVWKFDLSIDDSGLGKIEKIYIDNPNLMTVLASGTPDIGNIRETFFYNQMRVRNDVISSKESDFCIGQYTFEVGGKRKGKKQVNATLSSIVSINYMFIRCVE